jgi:hypothetical protein
LLKRLGQIKQNFDLVAITILLMNLARLSLLMLPFKFLMRVFNRLGQLDFWVQKQSISVSKIIYAVNWVSFWMPGHVKCLARALTAQTLMQWYGYPSDLCIGVAKDEANVFEAHAWVEYQGKVVIGYLDNFSRFVRLPSLQEKVRL